MASNNLSSHIIPATKAIKESVARVLSQREALSKASGLLKPGEVAGEYSVSRLLSTTLGGVLRPLTHDDLRKFEVTVKKLGKKFTGGITAQSVIDMSLKIDRDRANEEIRTSVPMSTKAGVIHFVTNSGPNSDVARHHVYVEFLNYSAALASPVVSSAMVKPLTQGKLRYTCDCGRHTFWFSYLCTVGKFSYGDPQVNFPKIRNPKLVGVACKHVLRVMQQLNMPIIRTQVEKMIERGRSSLDRKPKVMTKKEAEDLAKQQTAQTNWKRNQVETAGEKQDRLKRAKKVQIIVAKANAKIMSPKAQKNVVVARKAFEVQARKLEAMGLLTSKQVTAMLAKLK